LPLQGKISFPVDHFVRGILAGLFSNAFHTDLDCLELKCIASGSSECEFIVNKPYEFDFGKETTRKQLDPKI
ncbi:4-vinyl reductase, partial [Candidatus Micrarchaeota archaeon]|nr:4-vinyl reductase [Candidatus Micrarchaeota archaeon]